jgi:hypothetical protein
MPIKPKPIELGKIVDCHTLVRSHPDAYWAYKGLLMVVGYYRPVDGYRLRSLGHCPDIVEVDAYWCTAHDEIQGGEQFLEKAKQYGVAYNE